MIRHPLQLVDKLLSSDDYKPLVRERNFEYFAFMLPKMRVINAKKHSTKKKVSTYLSVTLLHNLYSLVEKSVRAHVRDQRERWPSFSRYVPELIRNDDRTIPSRVG